jgi:CubicO group peptidase (beta-lactamase class C family)
MKKLRIVVLALWLIVGCAGPGTVATPQPAATATSLPALSATAPTLEPYWPTQGWRTSTPEQQGMDSAQLVQMLDAVTARKLDLHSILIIRNGYLVAEVYYGSNSPTLKHELYSVTKSFTSALVGMAIQKGFIDSVNRPVLDLFADRQVAALDARKKAMTLEHLLTMSSGLDWPESGSAYTTTDNPYVRMMRSPDWVQFVLDQPMAQQPGATFNYNSGASHLLSAIVQKTTKMSTLAFAQEYLFKPLGITDVLWGSDASGIAVGGSDLRLTPRDMAKFGYLYLKDGGWEGQQIVPAEWVKTSTTQQIKSDDAALDYGYQWWVYSDGSFAAHGLGGQYIFVRPRQDLIVVFTSWLTGSDTEQPPALMDSFIVPAARSSVSLPENPEALAQLKARIEAARAR